MILQNEGFSNIRLELEQATCPLLRPLRSMASSIPTEAARNGAIEDRSSTCHPDGTIHCGRVGFDTTGMPLDHSPLQLSARRRGGTYLKAVDRFIP